VAADPTAPTAPVAPAGLLDVDHPLFRRESLGWLVGFVAWRWWRILQRPCCAR